MNMSSSTYEGLNNSYTSWFCSNCDSSNFSTSLFESTSVVSTNNSFNLPVAENTSTTTQCDFTPFVASSPKETPTQSYRNTPGRKQSGFKVLNVNFQSVRNKAAELAALISKHKLDVIIGTETHLSPEINSSEIFSDNFCVHRRDRDCHGGGTVIAIRDNLNSIRRSDLETDCEIIWVEILSPNNKSALVGSFYRPPSSFLAVIMSLEESLIKAFSAASNHLLILGGDFNLPGVNWITRSVKPSARDPHLCHRLLDVTNDLHLSQMVMEPTRRSDTTANNLDLLHVSKPDLVSSVYVSDGLSDQDAVLATFSYHLKYNKTPYRNILDFRRGDQDAFLKDMRSFSTQFLSTNPDKRSVEENWGLFKTSILNTATKHFPQRSVKHQYSNPWFSRELCRRVRKKQRLYRQAKRSDTPKPERNSSPLEKRSNLIYTKRRNSTPSPHSWIV